MTLPPHLRARALTLLIGLVVGLAGLFALPAGAASAHAALISTNPVAGSVVPAAPSEIVITFSEHVTPVREKISVVGPGQKRIDSGTATSVGDELRIPVRADVAEGTYLVSYRVISADSHPVGNGFYYSVIAKSAGGAPKPIDGGANDPLVSTLVSVMQFIGFAGLCLVVGPALVLIALWPRRLDRRAPTKVAFVGLGAVAGATVLGLYLQAPYGTGSSLFGIRGSDISDVMDTHFGQALMVRLAVLVMCAFLLRPVLAGRGTKTDHVLLGVLAAIGIGTWPFAGHPTASSVPPLTVIADEAHLISVSIWLGGLFMLAAFLLRRANARELGAILPVWSNWATLAVTVLVLGGTAQALIEIGSFNSLFHTTYGQLVLVKVGVLAVILAFAAGARKVVARHAAMPAVAVPVAVGVGSRGGVALAERVELSPQDVQEAAGADVGGADGGVTGGSFDPDGLGNGGLDKHDVDGDDVDGGDFDGGDGEDGDSVESRGIGQRQLKRLRRSVLAELALAVVVLVATSILVQSSPARNAASVTTDTTGTVSLTSPLYTLQVDFLPSAGTTDIHMFAFTPAGGPLPVKTWTVVATLASQNLTENLGISVITQTHAITEAILPVPGNWTFTFTLRTTDVDEATVSTVVPIS
jgi:copper transport protein